MEFTNTQYGLLMILFGMGLTLITLYILTWTMRLITSLFKEKEEEEMDVS